ncbi:MAG: HDOD domain-containing protein [Deltaproteobacteria bacterium]|nr:HDOD domain-containing protein [Deltaproteobacteria bacterium]MBW2019775.1 HDOD domain-containing protein [Deltaproteobacteria bacterium]MBW2074655.1 HDOD domain-containing protein [Deltaproteobacteria bacterium]RLB83473.1 MAG: HDOD domain-containing protein [Deltaproteobacteria bacterium]
MIDVDVIIKSINKLPPFPDVASRALQILDDPRASVDQVISVIQYDQAVTANVLKLCNSAYYGLRRKVHSLREGLVLLGNAELKSIILASTTVRLFQQENKGYDLAKGELWKHAVATGIISKIISDRVGASEHPSLFTAALLHDIGKVVLNSFVDRYFEQIIALVNEGELSFLEAESKMLGINHAEVGAKTGESWNFPGDIVQAIRLHHSPEEVLDDDPITPIIYLANIITLSMGIGVGRDGLSYRGKQEVLKHYGLKAKDLQEIVVDFYDQYSKVQDILKLS